MKNYLITFHAMNGASLGSVEVSAKSEAKAKILASVIYACPWASQSAEAA